MKVPAIVLTISGKRDKAGGECTGGGAKGLRASVPSDGLGGGAIHLRHFLKEVDEADRGRAYCPSREDRGHGIERGR